MAHSPSTQGSTAASSRKSSTAQDELQDKIDLAVKLAVAETRIQLIDDLTDWADEQQEETVKKHLDELRIKFTRAYNELLADPVQDTLVKQEQADGSPAAVDSTVRSDVGPAHHVTVGYPAPDTSAQEEKWQALRDDVRDTQAEFNKALSHIKELVCRAWQPGQGNAAKNESSELNQVGKKEHGVRNAVDDSIDSGSGTDTEDAENGSAGCQDGDSLTVPKSKAEQADLLADTVDDMLEHMRSSFILPLHEEKLFVWQTLCLELGLAKLGPHSERPNAFKSVRFALDKHFPNKLAPYELFATDMTLPDLPLTLTACSKLLHAQAHVNILDYCAARRERMSTINRYKSMVGAKVTWNMQSALNNQGAFAHLLQPSAGEMIRSSKRKNRVVKRGVVKDNWLDPLMRRFT